MSPHPDKSDPAFRLFAQHPLSTQFFPLKVSNSIWTHQIAFNSDAIQKDLTRSYQFIQLSISKSQVKCRNPGVPGCQYGANNVGWPNILGALTYTLYSIYFIHYIFYIMQWRPNILWALPVAVSPHYDPIRGSPLLPRINISLCVHKRRHYFPNMSIDRRRRTDAPTVIAIGFVPLPISKLSAWSPASAD